MKRKSIPCIETVTVLSTNRMELPLLQPCILEEVDTCLAVHTLDKSLSGHKRIKIKQWWLSWSFQLLIKSMSTKGPGRGDTCHLTDFSETWPDWRAYPITEKAKTVWQLQFSGGSYTTPLLFSRKFLQILHKIRVTVRSSKTWAIHLIPLRLHMSVNMSLVSYMSIM